MRCKCSSRFIIVEESCRLIGNTQELNDIIERNEFNSRRFELVKRTKFPWVLKMLDNRDQTFKKNVLNSFNNKITSISILNRRANKELRKLAMRKKGTKLKFEDPVQSVFR